MDSGKREIKEIVKKSYSDVAKGSLSFLAPSSCCGPGVESVTLLEAGKRLGYSEDELKVGLGEANLGLGCGNPLAIAELKGGEAVLDLGSGAGFDAILCSMRVGENGKVIGVDMTADMVEKAKANAAKLNVRNIEFRHGEIEHLPLDDNAVDVIISNCVINLSPDKQAVYREAFRVLRPGGRIAISDILKRGEFSKQVLDHEHAYSG
jgi:SAM-dependent methyltransferase